MRYGDYKDDTYLYKKMEILFPDFEECVTSKIRLGRACDTPTTLRKKVKTSRVLLRVSRFPQSANPQVRRHIPQ